METHQTPTALSQTRDSFIVCRNSQGLEIRASLLRLTRYLIVFEVYNPYSILQLSEVLTDFQIFMNERLVYSGRAVVSNLVNTGVMLVCEASLDESWLEVDIFSPITQPGRLRTEFDEFIKEWEKIHLVVPEFKVVVADMQSLLVDLQRWLEQIELSIRSEPSRNRLDLEREVIGELKDPLMPNVTSLFGRFEEVATAVEANQKHAHRNFVKRQLHPLLLCSPFMHRIFYKPLGYAGDYEMVNMILRDPHEGSSLFAKILNVYILGQAPAEAHRNRVRVLTQKLNDETRRAVKQRRNARVLNLGCGPAGEIQNFLLQDDLCQRAELTLLDFNDETLQHTGKILNEIKIKEGVATPTQMVKKSVHQVLKEAGRPSAFNGQFDFIYCAGLFDYMSDRICRRLMNVFYDWLAPGGLVLATNVDASNPIRNVMELIFEWHLVYRNERQFAALAPDKSPPGAFSTYADSTGANIFIEVRKPESST